MSGTTKIPSAVAITLAAVALAAPAAGAMPLRDASEFDAGHASLAQGAHARQDLRSPDTRDAALNPRPAVSPYEQITGQPGPPAFPTYHEPVATSSTPPAIDDGGIPWVTILLGVAGTGIAAGGAVGVSRSARRTRRARVAV